MYSSHDNLAMDCETSVGIETVEARMNRDRIRELEYRGPDGWTEDDLTRAVIREARQVWDGLLRPVVVRWDAFSSDPRLSWEIPEVVTACRAIVSSGYIVLMHANLPPRRFEGVYGAIDVYLCAHGNVASLDPLASLRPDEGFGECIAAATRYADALAALRRDLPRN